MSKVSKDAYQHMKNGTLLRKVIKKMNDILDFNDSRNCHLLAVYLRERTPVRSQVHRITETLEVL